MTAELQIFREEGEFAGYRFAKLACSCGFVTFTTIAAGRAEQEAQARRELEEHWLADHPDELAEMGAGACAQCGRLTDHVRIRSALAGPDAPAGAWAYLCPVHAPAERLRAVLGGGDG